jgi:mRNA interferase MazF
MIVPGTTNTKFREAPNIVIVSPSSQNGLTQETAFLCHQTRSIDKKRLRGTAIGKLLKKDFEVIESSLAYCTGLAQPH